MYTLTWTQLHTQQTQLSNMQVYPHLSSSRIRPLTSLRACSRDCSRCLSLNRNSPCSLSRSDLFLSTSGRSAFNTWFRHWVCSDPRVTVKFTKVTREQRSGGNSTCVSMMERVRDFKHLHKTHPNTYNVTVVHHCSTHPHNYQGFLQWGFGGDFFTPWICLCTPLEALRSVALISICLTYQSKLCYIWNQVVGPGLHKIQSRSEIFLHIIFIIKINVNSRKKETVNVY